jgi:ubiquinone/menaquinone biosynthesis C-methylase UbiE
MIMIEKIPGPFASIYEKATRMVIESYYGQVADEVVSYLQGGTLLDLGTGPGYLPIEIVKRSPTINVDGIDTGRKLIKMAQRNASKAGIADRVHFEVGNASKLPFADESYDMVISTGMLHMLKEPIKVLRECHRVLKQGGEAWIYDPAQVSNKIDKNVWKASFNTYEKLIYRVFRLYALINPSHPYDREQIDAMIAETDFAEYRIEGEGKEIRVKLRK